MAEPSPRTSQLERLSAVLADRYRLGRELGRGGMATVYLADDVKHLRQVAIKVLRDELASLLAPDRFLREVTIAAQLSHPHILPLFDSGEADGSLFYVMPYIQGETLRQKLDRNPQLPVDEALEITRHVASALAHAHARGIVHRDIKPENILLLEGEAIVADFGIALATSDVASDRLTETGLVIGTPAYSSPEQAMSDRAVDARSDLYSLACVLYEMLAGETPYSGRNTQAVLAKKLVDAPPLVRRLRPTVPASVEQAISSALAPSPADRFASVTAFVEALSAPARARAPTVAVLPFRNVGGGIDDEYFADGITEDVIAHLSKMRAMKVISRASVMPFKGRAQGLRAIGAELGASTLLDGSVRHVGDRVRIVAQLIDAESDQHLWSETYDRQLTDIFAIQTDVALQIAAALKTELTGDEASRITTEPTADVQAYQLYLQGRHWLVRYTPESMQRAITFFERAIERDPRYSLAYASLALAMIEMGESGTVVSDEAYASARAATATALRLDPLCGAAHCTAGYLHMVAFEWAAAEREFTRSLELSPGSADTYDYYGRYCSAVERYDEALALVRRAQELDPLAHRVDVATMLLRAGRPDEAVAEAERAMELEPALDRANATLGWAYIKSGRAADGLAALERAVALAPDNTQWLAQLGEAYGLTGDAVRARSVLGQLEARAAERYVSPYHLAFVYTGLGDQERALDHLERAYAERAGAVYGFAGSFLLAPLRSHPRFRALLRRLNLA